MPSVFNKSIALLLLIGLSSCEQDIAVYVEEIEGEFKPTYVEMLVPTGFSTPDIPADNPLTEEGIALGRKLFHDPILSGDNTQSCADCHLAQNGFSDPKQFSIGIDGIAGNRNASAIINAAWNKFNFWDGRASTLEDQALGPVVNPIEMHAESWADEIKELKGTADYPELFKAAFNTYDFDSTHVAKAIAQFERTLVSYNSRYDSIVYLKTAEYTISEARGREIFFTERGDCFHCHAGPNLMDNDFHNNGLDPEPFPDLGYYEVTKNDLDKGKFKTPTLRNIEFTAPYMHDGRFETLEEVIDHYNSGGIYSSTLDPNMKNFENGLGLSGQEKRDLLNFLKTFSDHTFIQSN